MFEKNSYKNMNTDLVNGVKEKHREVSYEEWVNPQTGESRLFAVIMKETADFDFHKVWIDDLAKILGLLGGAKVQVFKYILDNINPYSNEFGGTNREIAKKIGVDGVTVNRTIKTLIEADFMKKVRTGTYLINSRVLVRGSHDKRVGLMLKYNGIE